jgi:hypothetical protein
MSAALDLIQTVKANGGELRVDDGWLVITPEGAAAPVLEELRQHKAEIVALLQTARTQLDDPPDWLADLREPFEQWLKSECVREPRCFGGARPLHLAFCEWETARNEAPCTRDAFERLLTELGFLIGKVNDDLLVSGLAFRNDVSGARAIPDRVRRHPAWSIKPVHGSMGDSRSCPEANGELSNDARN